MAATRWSYDKNAGKWTSGNGQTWTAPNSGGAGSTPSIGGAHTAQTMQNVGNNALDMAGLKAGFQGIGGAKQQAAADQTRQDINTARTNLNGPTPPPVQSAQATGGYQANPAGSTGNPIGPNKYGRGMMGAPQAQANLQQAQADAGKRMEANGWSLVNGKWQRGPAPAATPPAGGPNITPPQESGIAPLSQTIAPMLTNYSAM